MSLIRRIKHWLGLCYQPVDWFEYLMAKSSSKPGDIFATNDVENIVHFENYHKQ